MSVVQRHRRTSGGHRGRSKPWKEFVDDRLYAHLNFGLLVLQHVCLFRVDLHIEQSSGKMGPENLTDSRLKLF